MFPSQFKIVGKMEVGEPLAAHPSVYGTQAMVDIHPPGVLFFDLQEEREGPGHFFLFLIAFPEIKKGQQVFIPFTAVFKE